MLLYLFPSHDPGDIYFTSPQITFDAVGTVTYNSTRPTNLTSERETSITTQYKSGFNWSGKAVDILSIGISDRDSMTLRNNPASITYSISANPLIEDPASGLAVYDRAEISRSVDSYDGVDYRVINRTIFRDRTDLETEQISPNENLNYKNLNERRALTKAYSYPIRNGGSSYRSVGTDIGSSLHSTYENPRFVVNTPHTSSLRIEYDNGYIQRDFQNNYHYRWYRNLNLVRLTETNNAPYINRFFRSAYSSIIGDLVSYKPLTEKHYEINEIQTLPTDEYVINTVSQSRSGGLM